MSWTRLLVVGAVALVAVPVVSSQAAAPSAPPASAPFVQPCGGSSWTAGTTNVCDGTVVYRDYVFDDAGADTGDLGYGVGTQSAYGTLAHPAGDVRYPVDAISTADLVELRLSREGDRLRVVAELNALHAADSTLLALALDTDDDTSTGGGDWEGLGIRSDGWEELHVLETGDPVTNTITGTVPLPDGPSFRVQAVTAQRATGTVMNVAFRGTSERAAYKLDYTVDSPYPIPGRGAWFEDDQAAALAAGEVSSFGASIALADLQPGVERLEAVGPGLHERVYASAFTLPPGEGMVYTGIPGRGTGGSASAFAQVFNFVGKYQPYGVYVPETGGPYGLQMEWHGSNQGIVAQINQPGMQQQFGEDLDRLLVTPLARGPNGYGSDISERDLLDVMADVQRAYDVDPDRVFSSGYSQGGYIAFRMAMLHPHLFAGFTSWVGFTGNDTNGTPVQGTVDVTAGAVGNMVEYVANARHVPGSMVYAAADELVQVPSATAMERAFAAQDNQYAWWMHGPADHFTFAQLDDWQKEADHSRDLRLVRDPARVTFGTDPFLDSPEHGILHDRAYWVSALRGRDEGRLDVDLTSYGCGVSVPTTTEAPGAGPSPVPWVSSAREVTGPPEVLPAQQLLEGTLTNVASLQLDPAATCLRPGFAYRLTADGPGTLALPGGSTVTLAEGLNEGVVGTTAAAPGAPQAAPVRAAAPAVDSAAGGSAGPALPATGADALLPVAGLAMLGLVALRRRRL